MKRDGCFMNEFIHFIFLWSQQSQIPLESVAWEIISLMKWVRNDISRFATGLDGNLEPDRIK